jgi:hypothetical protein
LTGNDDRQLNMVAFATSALGLLAAELATGRRAAT